MRCRVQGKRVPAVLRRGRRLRVVIFSEKTSHGKPRLPEMLHEQVQVADPRIREPVDNFELNRPEFVPPRARLALRQGVVEEPAALGLVRPCPSDVHLLEVHVGAVSAQSTRVGLHGEQRVLADAAARYVDKHDLAWPHQVEPLAVHILQMWIANGRLCRVLCRSGRRCWVVDLVNICRPIAVAHVAIACLTDHDTPTDARTTTTYRIPKIKRVPTLDVGKSCVKAKLQGGTSDDLALNSPCSTTTRPCRERRVQRIRRFHLSVGLYREDSGGGQTLGAHHDQKHKT
mmetsp:Transcript_41906/g.116899  ORF Transcript_41906/g.116899 Transcript_41906/m.116899 type:complete len:287 (-) Transcript_41906:107-967(-)